MRIVAPVVIAVLLLIGGGRSASAQNLGRAIQDLATSTVDSKRVHAVRFLGQSGDQRAISACVRALQNDSNERVRFWAARALARLITGSSLGGDRARVDAALSKAATSDPKGRVRRAAKEARSKVLKVQATVSSGATP